MPSSKPTSAGLLLYRGKGNDLLVLLVHPSGNYNRHKPWGIPKGIPDEGEDFEAAARRETWEEAGVRYDGPVVPLGTIKYQKTGKVIHAFAAEGPGDQEPRCASWEVDQSEYVTLKKAYDVIHPDQAAFLDRLLEYLKVSYNAKRRLGA